MPTTWILIADGAKARVVEQDKESRRYRPAFEEAHFGAAAAPSREIASDRPGRTFDSGGEGRHAMEPSTDPQRHAKLSFARDLAERLSQAANRNEFDRLILVAAPRTLGDLRSLLSDSVKSKVVVEIDKDLTNTPDQDLGKHLDEHLKQPLR
ncbi:MAG: host attachment protein [Geminicoccaceae bacterium]|nr:host attachment protein [Geminicoccaceae bacterium]